MRIFHDLNVSFLPHRSDQVNHEVLEGHTGAVRAVAFSADNKHMATAGADSSVILWEVRPNPNPNQNQQARRWSLEVAVLYWQG